MSNSVPAIVIRGNDICFLGIIRSLAKENIPFKTITFTWPTAKPWISEHSKYFNRDYVIENPYSNSDIAVGELINIGKQLFSQYKKRLLVIPSSDTNLMLFLDHEELLSPYFILMGDVEFNSYRQDVAHKFSCFKLLSKNPKKLCPNTFSCLTYDDIERVVNNCDFPVVFKPATKDYGQSFYQKYDGLKAVECTDKNSLEAELTSCIAEGFDVIVQEKIIFEKVEDEIPFYAYVDSSHNIRMAATGVKELIQPYPFGTANILRLSWHAELLEIASNVVKALKWRGIIMIEFIRDEKDGQWKVIEVNVRPWLFIGFYERFGLNYLSMLYKDWQSTIGDFNGNVITPLPETQLLAPLHVDLNGAAQYTIKDKTKNIFTEKNNSLIRWLGSYGSCITTPYFDIEDKEPNNISLQLLSKETAISESYLVKDLDRLLSNSYQHCN